MLIFIGIGTSLDTLTLEALKAIRSCDKVYIDAYTSLVEGFDINKFYKLTGKKPVLLKRKDLEGREAVKIVEDAQKYRVALLVGGDPFIATTHVSLRIEAEKRGVPTKIYHGISAYTAAISLTGLQIYKFGKPVTVVYPVENIYPYTTYFTLLDNLRRGLHTFLFLDLRFEDNIFMSIPDAVNVLFEIENKLLDLGEIKFPLMRSVLGVGVAKAGTDKAVVKTRLLNNMVYEEFPSPPHSLIILGKLHEMEIEALRVFGGLREEDITVHNNLLSKILQSNRGY